AVEAWARSPLPRRLGAPRLTAPDHGRLKIIERQRGTSALEPGREADAHGGPEELLGPLVERAEDPVELVVVDVLGRQLPHEEHGVLLPDGERSAVELEVAAQQVLVERP